ncbi:hypothetical protein AB0C16_40715, partial [Nonomuraea sp. NPDC048916]
GHKQPSILYTVGERHRERAAMISDALEAVDPFELRSLTEKFADELIDAVCAKGETDLVADYAALLPVRVLALLYGFAEEQGPVTAVDHVVQRGDQTRALFLGEAVEEGEDPYGQQGRVVGDEVRLALGAHRVDQLVGELLG